MRFASNLKVDPFEISPIYLMIHQTSFLENWFDSIVPVEDDNSTLILFSEILTEQEQKNLVSNIVKSMNGISGSKKYLIINRQFCHFTEQSLIQEWQWLKAWVLMFLPIYEIPLNKKPSGIYSLKAKIKHYGN